MHNVIPPAGRGGGRESEERCRDSRDQLLLPGPAHSANRHRSEARGTPGDPRHPHVPAGPRPVHTAPAMPGAVPVPVPVPVPAPRATHRHQELQRGHVVPLGLLQLAEHAHAQAELPLRVPAALLAHGGMVGGRAAAGKESGGLCKVRGGIGDFTGGGEAGAGGGGDGRGRPLEPGRGRRGPPPRKLPRGLGLRPGTCAPGPAAPASHGPGSRGGGSGSHRGDLDINQMLCIHVTPTLYPSPNLRKKETQPWGSVLRAS